MEFLQLHYQKNQTTKALLEKNMKGYGNEINVNTIIKWNSDNISEN